MNRLETRSPDEGLQVSLAAYKSLVSDYALRARQAEDMVQLLMSELPKDVLVNSIVSKVQQHIEARGIERSTQYLGVIQTTLLALTKLNTEQPNEALLTIIKALTLTINPN